MGTLDTVQVFDLSDEGIRTKITLTPKRYMWDGSSIPMSITVSSSNSLVSSQAARVRSVLREVLNGAHAMLQAADHDVPVVQSEYPYVVTDGENGIKILSLTNEEGKDVTISVFYGDLPYMELHSTGNMSIKEAHNYLAMLRKAVKMVKP